MSNRITDRDLNEAVDRLNEMTRRPKDTYTRYGDGTLRGNIGSYYVDHAYGGVCLNEITSEGGAVRTPLGSGYRTKRELWDQIRYYSMGYSAGVEDALGGLPLPERRGQHV